MLMPVAMPARRRRVPIRHSRLDPPGATGTDVACSAYPQSPAGPKEDTPMIRPSRSAKKSRLLLPFLVFSVLALCATRGNIGPGRRPTVHNDPSRAE